MDLKIGDKIRVRSSLRDSVEEYGWDRNMNDMIDKVFTIRSFTYIEGCPGICAEQTAYVIPIKHLKLVCSSYILDESQIILNQDI